jgi:formate/nitrite transporter FocA (FNT family)
MLFICNSAGVIATRLLSKLCINDTVKIEEFIKSKMDRTPTEIIISAVFCGLIIGMCTIGFKMTNNLLIPVIATIAVIFTGLNDVLSCIYCLTIYNYSMSTLNIVLFILMVFIGNVIGGILSSFLNLSYLKEDV